MAGALVLCARTSECYVCPHAVSQSLEPGVTKETGIPDGFMGLDCGPKSIEENAQVRSAEMC